MPLEVPPLALCRRFDAAAAGEFLAGGWRSGLPLPLPEPERMTLPDAPDDFLTEIRRRVVADAVAPLLRGDELETAMPGCLEAYRRWTAFASARLSAELADAERQRLEDAAEAELRTLFEASAAAHFGPEYRQFLLQAQDIRRDLLSETPSNAAQPAPRPAAVYGLLLAQDLCAVAVAQHIAYGLGRFENAQRLARWSFGYARQAQRQSAANG